MALVEDHHFTLQFEAHMPEPWASVDWDADPEYPWTSAADDSPEELQALWEASVGRAPARRSAGPRSTSSRSTASGTSRPTCAGSLVDMIEEYARHTGHADLIRESLDGLVGEDAPR